jgi:hypothetical protein
VISKWTILSVATLLMACSTDPGGQYVAADTGATEDTTAPADVADVVLVDLIVADVVEELVPMPDLIPGEVSEEEWAALYGEECLLEERIGFVEAYIDKDGDQFINGEIIDRIVTLRVLEELETLGDCRLLKRVAPECTPECIPQSEQCSLDEVCLPWQVQQDVGTLYLAGLNFHVAMKPNKSNAYNEYWNGGGLTGDAIFDDGALIAAHAAEGMYGPFTLQGHGVAPVVMVDPPKYVHADEDLALEWETSDGPGEIFVQVSLQNHATTPFTIKCLVEDSGSIAVPAAYVNKLLDALEEGTVAVTVQRRTVDAEDFKTGCIEFQVYSDWSEDLLPK